MAKLPQEVAVQITGLTAQGLGVGSFEQRDLYVRNALPGETVQARILRKQKGKLLADGVAVAEPSVDRRASACKYFPRCGGCSMHHMRTGAQLQLKQNLLSAALHEQGVVPKAWTPPHSAGRLGYRRKARMGVRQVGVHSLVGFRESFSNRVAHLQSCVALTPELSRMILPLRDLIKKLTIADRIPQIEVAQGDGQCVLMVRHLAPFTAQDMLLWVQLQKQFDVRILLQSKGYDTLKTLDGGPVEPLGYQILEHGLYMQFLPQQFTQVNLPMNLVLIRQVLAYLGDLRGKSVADLFCGIGNFTLPLARAGARVWGYEGADDAVNMARQNARLNGLEARVEFATLDLYGTDGGDPPSLPVAVDAIVLDPPRSGAGAHLPAWLAGFEGQEIVYVSCNPNSFAADAAIITAAGFELEKVGIFDMFPHTAHVETMGYFHRG